MTLNAPSFFAGIGTVVALLTLGFGGGVLISDVISDKTPREPSKVEKRAAEIAKPPVIETKPTAPVAAVAPQPAPPPAPAEPAPAPQVQQANSQPEPQPQTQRVESQPVPQVRRVDLPPPAPAQAQETRPDPQSNAPSVAIVRKVPLGAEQPVALVNPPQDRSAEQREARELREARKKARETQQLEKKRKLEQRKLVEQRRQQSIKEAEELKAATRSRQVEVDDKDERQERPAFFRREREEPFGRPFFRLFSDED